MINNQSSIRKKNYSKLASNIAFYFDGSENIVMKRQKIIMKQVAAVLEGVILRFILDFNANDDYIA